MQKIINFNALYVLMLVTFINNIIFGMESVTLISIDNQKFQVDLSVVNASNTIKLMREEIGGNELNFPNINGVALETFIYVAKRRNELDQSSINKTMLENCPLYCLLLMTQTKHQGSFKRAKYTNPIFWLASKA